LPLLLHILITQIIYHRWHC